MKLYKFLALACTSILLIAGCGTPSGRVKVSKVSVGSTNQPAAIEVFDLGEAPERAYRPIAYLSYDAVMGEFLDVVREFKLKARELGADAIILDEPVRYTGDRHPDEHLVFRATVIAYHDRGARASR